MSETEKEEEGNKEAGKEEGGEEKEDGKGLRRYFPPATVTAVIVSFVIFALTVWAVPQIKDWYTQRSPEEIVESVDVDMPMTLFKERMGGEPLKYLPTGSASSPMRIAHWQTEEYVVQALVSGDVVVGYSVTSLSTSFRPVIRGTSSLMRSSFAEIRPELPDRVNAVYPARAQNWEYSEGNDADSYHGYRTLVLASSYVGNADDRAVPQLIDSTEQATTDCGGRFTDCFAPELSAGSPYSSLRHEVEVTTFAIFTDHPPLEDLPLARVTPDVCDVKPQTAQNSCG